MEFTVELWGKQAPVQISVVGQEDGSVGAWIGEELLDPRIVKWAIEYGFRQGIRDAGAQGKTDDERNAGALKRVDALVNNTLREGGGGGAKLTPIQREMRVIAAREIGKAFDNPANANWVAEQRKATGLTLSELKDKAIKAHLVKHADRLQREAQAVLDASTDVEIDLSDVA